MLKINELSRLHLGVEKENLSRTIEIDMSAWAATYPNATVEILHKRQGDQTKYLTGATYDSDTMILSWTPTEYDTYDEGYGVAEIRMMEGEVVKKTKDLIITAVCPSVIDGSGNVVASNYQAFLNSVIGYKNDAQTAAAAAEAAAVHGPYIDDETGNWFVWDAEEEEYVNTEIHAQGPPGSIDNVYATGIAMSVTDPTTVKQAMDSKANASAIPTKTSQLTNDSGFLTQHQDISGKLDKDQGSENAGKFMKVGSDGKLTPDAVPDPTGKLDKDQGSENAGKFMKVGSDGLLTPDTVPDPTGKADKVSGATSGNFAALDSNGNLTDSGHKHGDYLTSHQDISGKLDSDNVAEEYSSSKTYAVGDLCIHNGKLYRATVATISAPWSDLSWTQTDVETELNEKTGKISGGTTGNLVGIGSGGVLTDSGSKPEDFAAAADLYANKIPMSSSDSTKISSNISNIQDSVNNLRKGLVHVAKLTSGNWQLNSGENAAIGEYVSVNGYLGHATAAITGGSTNIVENTNWVKESAGGALNAILDDIPTKTSDLTNDSGFLTSHQDISGKANNDEIGIVVTGNKTAVGVTASQGQYVILQNSTIAGKPDGLYKAAQAIPADTAIDGTYLTDVAGGLGAEVAALNSKLSSLEVVTVSESNSTAISAGGYWDVEKSYNPTGYKVLGIVGWRLSGANNGMMLMNVVNYRSKKIYATFKNVYSSSVTPTEAVFYVLRIATTE